jgi:hypothetical protein
MSSSSALCTSVPLLAHGDGGSGSRSTYENLNARGHSLNAAIELGESDGGIERPMG